MDLGKYIKDISKKLNIDIIGFTDSEKLDVKDYLLKKRESGKFTEFEEEDLQKRIDPKLSMESAKSIIVIGLSYNTGFKPRKKHQLNGKLSMSSWGIDYHKVLEEKMEKLIAKIKEKVDFEYKAYVDTGPLVDRELAKKAGVGYYGKNCSIINEEYGSFVFLGYILINKDLNPDNSIKEDCGDCDLCLKACPTGALEGAYSMNPKRCISYLTQTKDKIPVILQDKMGTSIYGCDICQKVCPKNKGIKPSSQPEFIPYRTEGVMDLEELLFMSNRNFKKEYGFISGSWRGKNTLKRNAIIAIGNMRDEKNIPLLLEARENSNDILKEYIDEAIEKILKSTKIKDKF